MKARSLLNYQFMVIVGSLYTFFLPEKLLAQKVDQNQPLNFEMTIPGIGTLPIQQQLFQNFAIIAIVVAAILFIVGIVLLFWSTLARFQRVPRDAALVVGWNATKQNLLFFGGMTMVYLVISNFFFLVKSVFGIINREALLSLETNLTAIKLIGTIDANFLLNAGIGFLFSSYAIAGFISLALAYVGTKQLSYKALTVSAGKYLIFLLGNIVYTFGIFLGSILFIIPAAWFGSRFFFWPYILLSKNVSVIQAFKESAQMTRGVKIEIFLFWFLTQVIMFTGLAIVGIGYFITFPLVILATAYIYQQLSQDK